MGRLKLHVQGWRGINHSYALVNQFQLLELLRRDDVALSHADQPYFLPQWNPQANGPGFNARHEAQLTALPALASGEVADWAYRIFSPINLATEPQARRLAVFVVTELGLDAPSFAEGIDLSAFVARGDIVVTPSHWSKDRIVDFGFPAHVVHVIPHGASPEYFAPMPHAVRMEQRKALGFSEDDVVLLNIGAAIWNKGVDVLLLAFARAHQARPQLKLLFKDQRSMYGFSGEEFVQKTLGAHGLWTAELANAIKLIPSNLTMPQMNSIYGVADCYVSPYRAEGFNMPVLEAMACGLPVLVTRGGATDDFVPDGGPHRKVLSTLIRNAVVQGKLLSAYREPDADMLVEMLTQTGHRPIATWANDCDMGWSAPVEQLVYRLNQYS